MHTRRRWRRKGGIGARKDNPLRQRNADCITRLAVLTAPRQRLAQYDVPEKISSPHYHLCIGLGLAVGLSVCVCVCGTGQRITPRCWPAITRRAPSHPTSTSHTRHTHRPTNTSRTRHTAPPDWQHVRRRRLSTPDWDVRRRLGGIRSGHVRARTQPHILVTHPPHTHTHASPPPPWTAPGWRRRSHRP